MGVNKTVLRQTFGYSFVNYLGVAIGIVSNLFIYPNDREFLGIIRYIDSVALVLMPILLMGASQTLVNFFPNFTSAEKKNRFFNKILLFVLLNSLFIGALVFLLLQLFSDYLQQFVVIDYIFYSLALGFFLAFTDVFKKQATNYSSITVPSLLDRLLPKIFLPLIFLLFFSKIITQNQGVDYYIVGYVVIAIILGIYVFNLIRKRKIGITDKKVSPPYRRDILKYSLFAFLGSFGMLFAFRIDGLMIPNLLSMEANGSYSIGFVLASTLAIPAVGLFAIYGPMVSNWIKKGEYKLLQTKYKSVSKNLFAIGMLLYGCIFLGIADVVELLPTKDNLLASVPVMLILGVSMVVNMSTGFNTEIISYSKYYKFNIVAVFILLIVNIFLNLFFIKSLQLGIEGVAYATLISMILYNMGKLLFIYKKLQLFPFDADHLKLLLIFSVTGAVAFYVPTTQSFVADFFIKLILFLGVSVFFIYKLKIFPFFNTLRRYF